MPKATITPHAGYPYSGSVAARAFSQLAPAAGSIEREVLLGPLHHVSFFGLAGTPDAGFATPLGVVPVDREAMASISGHSGVCMSADIHEPEHSLEVELPFLQMLPGEFRLVPLVTGEAGAKLVADVLAHFWGGPETVIVVSSDLSHFLDDASARARDRSGGEGNHGTSR